MVRYLSGYYVRIIYEEGVLRDPNSFYIYFIFMHYCVYMIRMCGTTGTDVLYIDYRCTDNLYVKKFFPYYFPFSHLLEKLLPKFFSNSCRVSVFNINSCQSITISSLINVKRYSSDWITTLMNNISRPLCVNNSASLLSILCA